MQKNAGNDKKVLILTNKHDITADFVVIELQKRGKGYIRFNTEDFPGRTSGSVYFGDDNGDGGEILTFNVSLNRCTEDLEACLQSLETRCRPALSPPV